MTLSAIVGLAVVVFATSFLSGIFGLAGGLILMGALLLFLPVASAMVLHATTQIAANGARAFLWRRHADYRIVGRYLVGGAVAFALFASIRFVPDQALVLIALGVMPFVGFLLPERVAPRADRRFGAEFCGFLSTALQLISGVSGPALDIFLIRSDLDRRGVVATKATCQTATHAFKLVYFGGLIGAGFGDVPPAVVVLAMALAVLGTNLARTVLERLSDVQFRRWMKALMIAIGSFYMAQGVHLYLTR
ncbi:MAG TPA: sulfite exporter TauE/SafE family protein [Beijerinckiaceae bacterium]|jgi:uncharacterized membrane protein YfcA